MKSFFTTTILFLSTLPGLFAQVSEINGDVRDADSNLVTNYTVLLKSGSEVIRDLYSLDGYFAFKNVPPGEYILKVLLEGDSSVSSKIKLGPGITLVKHFAVVGVETMVEQVVRPLTEEGTVITPKQTPLPDVISIIENDPVIVRSRNGFFVGGNRPGATVAIKDGVLWQGLTPLAGMDLLALDAVWSGVPVRYGDFTGGAARFTTSTPTMQKRKSVEVYSSSPFNPYHHNRFHSFMTGPLKTEEVKSDSNYFVNPAGDTIAVPKRRMVLGYNLSTFLIYQKDPNPGYFGIDRLTEDALHEIEQEPLVTGEQTNSFVPSASFVKQDQITNNKVRNHAGYTDAAADLKLHYTPNPYMTLELVNNFRYTRNRLYSFNNSLLNEARNPLQTQTNYAGYITLNHVLKSPYTFDGKPRQDSSDFFSDLMYSVQIDYQNRNVLTTDPTHHDRLFDYGYIGRTYSKQAPVYTYVENTPKVVVNQYGEEVVVMNYHEFKGYEDTALVFESGTANPVLARYNEIIFDHFNDITNESELEELGGILNGQNPANVYSLFNNVGTVTSGYSKVQNERIGITAYTEATFHPNRNPLVKHDLQFGMQHQQYTQSYYSLNARGLWRLMPLLANAHIEEVDQSDPFLTYDSKGRFTDTIRYNASADSSAQKHFDRALRNKLIREGYRDQNGNPVSSTSIIDINSLDPSVFSIDMFSADELLNDGNSYVAYSGYDHLGNRRRGRTSIQEFLSDPYNRPVDSYNPILSAAWIQDKFQIKDIIMRAGVRIERFDANQYILADPYSLFPVKTVAETRTTHPQLKINAGVPDHYLVYVDDATSPGKITGFRNNDQWFDASGQAISNPELIATQTPRGAVQPLLANPQQTRIGKSSFSEYNPVVNILPRLAFHFPMNSTSMFFVNYDKLAQRPPDAQTFAPLTTYYNFQSASSSVIPNAALKPRVKTDYLLGFKQLVGNYGTVSVSANYSEIRNDFNQVRINQAYPYSYTTYGNIDFSTVKSLKVSYGHRSKHVEFSLGYNLQSADGTGSNINSAQTLLQSGQPNLRSLYPLSYDVRHAIKGTFSLFDFASAEDDKKEALKRATLWNRVKENSVLNVSFRSYSGLPYTSLAQPVSEAQAGLGLVQRSQVKGNPFGSRMPWKMYVDARVEKTFILEKVERQGQLFPKKTLDVFLVADNLLNLKTIENVYRFTGRPDDDGYVNSPVGQQQARNQLDEQTFRMLYDIKLQNPLNYYNPRIVQIGFRINFI